MALTKAKKHQKVAGLAADLQGATAAIIGTFSAMTADKDISLRKTVRDAGGKYSVLKNKLAPKAGAGTKIEGALGGLKGVSSIAYTSGDPVALAKALAGLGEGQLAVHLQAGYRRRPGPRCERSPGSGDHAGQGRALRQAPVAHQRTGSAPGHRDERNRSRPRSRHQPGRREGEVCKGAEDAPVAAAPAAEEAPAVEAAPQIEAAPAAEDTEGASPQAVAAATEAPAEGA